MRLVAIYTKDHFLFSESLVNLGGKYIYDIQHQQENKYEVTRIPNTNYIENFWGENLSLVSAIVGENGAGKTSFFRNLNKIFSPYDKQDRMFDTIFIFENLVEDSFSYFSEIFEIDEITKIKRNEIETIYYSPVIDYDLTDINSQISMLNHHSESISTFYIQNIQRHLFFLKNTDLLESLQKSYQHFPNYEKITIKANKLYKDDFERVYIQATSGNNFYRVRNNLINLVRNSPFSFNDEKEVSDFFANAKGLRDELIAIWDLYKNNDQNNSHFVHDGKDFIKNLEINILSFLVINDTYTVNADNGFYDFNKIIESNNFVEMLNHFFNKFIIQTSRTFYNTLNNYEIKIENSDILLKELQNNSLLNNDGTINQIKIQVINKSIKNHIILFKDIFDFYNGLKVFLAKEFISEIEGGIEIDIRKLDINEFNQFINIYEELLQSKFTNLIPARSTDILEIKSTKKLSTGEKALLDLYSSIYDYLKRFRDHQYNENCIFLLDEADLGFHPEWKKRYINALTTTLPILISSVKDKIKNIQIIFATHDPLTLSDIPNTNVAYLKKEPYTTKVLSEGEKPSKSFGANITDLLADSFFINDGLIGDFAKNKINKTLNWLRIKANEKIDNADQKLPIDTKLRYTDIEMSNQYNKQIIELIDEPLVKYQLKELYLQNVIDEEYIDAEIERLTKLKK